MSFQFFLVGSGARNMALRRPDGTFDLDYQLEIMSNRRGLSDQQIKDAFTNALDPLMTARGFRNGKNSTSSLTYLSKEGARDFAFDVVITDTDGKGFYRILRADKGAQPTAYRFERLPESKLDPGKTARLRKEGLWSEVRGAYLGHKNENERLPEGSKEKSFHIYCRTVNEVYSKHFRE